MSTSSSSPTQDRIGRRRRLVEETPYERWDRLSRPVIILAALVPLLVIFDGGIGQRSFVVVEVLDFAFWGVFLVDLVMRLRLKPGYLRSGLGRLDLLVVVGTFPWYVVFGASGQLLGLLRLARLIRVVKAVVAVPGFRRLVSRLNRAMWYFVAIWLGCSYLVYQAEDGAAGFDSYGDAVWWGIVTMATVGYGDMVPTTTFARWVASVLIVAGVALMGTVAGSLASLFGGQDAEEVWDEENASDGANALDAEAVPGAGDVVGGSATSDAEVRRADPGSPEGTVGNDVLLGELQALRAEVANLRDSMGGQH